MNTRKSLAAWGLAAWVSVFAGGDARAATECTVSATSVAFGTYDPLAGADNDSVGELTVTCSYLSGNATRIDYAAALSAGSSGSYLQRRLVAGASWLGYNLYVDLARSQTWGDGTSGSFLTGGSLTVGPGVGNGFRQSVHAIYGRIPAMQDALPGTYTDTILVTLSF